MSGFFSAKTENSMSDEEDYMSDAFLKKCGDTRPGLVPDRIKRVQQQEQKSKKANAESKAKPRAVLEQEKRSEGLGAALSSNNKGFSLLAKMGFKPGMVLGKKGTGISEPIPLEVKTGRGGLGRESDMKRKQDQKTQFLKHLSAKRQRMESKHKTEFLQQMSEKFSNKNVDRDLYKAQKVCEQLDSQAGITEPAETFFWPEALLPHKIEKQQIDDTQGLESMQGGYSRYIQDDDDDDDLSDEDDCDNFEEDNEYSASDKLEVLTLYLRNKHKYCIWCGTKYEGRSDLESNCPGNTAEAHDD